MDFIIIKDKKYNIKSFETGGNNEGYIDFDKNKIGKVLLLSEYRKTNKKLDTKDYNENPYREIEIHKECNKIIKSKITTNLVKFYDYYIYDNKIIIIMDKYDGDLEKIIDKLTINQLWSIFFQIFFTFIILQDKLGFFQGDFGLNNILYKKISKTTKFFYYKYNGKKYKVPNEGYKIAISDYGNALIKKFTLANYEKDYYTENLSKRIELYEILLLLNNYLRKLTLNDDIYFQTKLRLSQDIIYYNVRFNLFNVYYTINTKFSEPADQKLLLETLYEDYIYK